MKLVLRVRALVNVITAMAENEPTNHSSHRFLLNITCLFLLEELLLFESTYFSFAAQTTPSYNAELVLYTQLAT